MSVIDYLKKPEYLFRPGQVLRRVQRRFGCHAQEEVVTLPWVMRLRIHPD